MANYEIGWRDVTRPVVVISGVSDVQLNYSQAGGLAGNTATTPNAYQFLDATEKSVGWAPFDQVQYVRVVP